MFKIDIKLKNKILELQEKLENCNSEKQCEKIKNRYENLKRKINYVNYTLYGIKKNF